MCAKPWRLRDPVHDLIELGTTEFDQVILRLLETREFQRLRRIRQLGFGDLVFPGATHSRFAHSVGVFHTARQLAKVLEQKRGIDTDKANAVIAAALIHDLGHGPFSHAFEKALKVKGRHEDWTRRFVSETAVGEVLGPLKDPVAKLFSSETPATIYSSIFSSQFDADRLDYMRRDRMMTGAQSAAIDYTWLVSNLEIGEIYVGSDETQFDKLEIFVLGKKSIWAGEEYVLGLFHLYPSIYLHKTTRGAERLFALLIRLVKERVEGDAIEQTGLPKAHPLIRFLADEKNIEAYMCLDDAVVWGALPLLAEAKDDAIAGCATRLRDRRLFKAIDILVGLGGENEQREAKFSEALRAQFASHPELDRRILIDRDNRNPYKRRSYDSPEALEKIHVLDSSDQPVDLAKVSPVVDALKPFTIYRAYVAEEDESARNVVETLMTEARK